MKTVKSLYETFNQKVGWDKAIGYAMIVTSIPLVAWIAFGTYLRVTEPEIYNGQPIDQTQGGDVSSVTPKKLVP